MLFYSGTAAASEPSEIKWELRKEAKKKTNTAYTVLLLDYKLPHNHHGAFKYKIKQVEWRSIR